MKEICPKGHIIEILVLRKVNINVLENIISSLKGRSEHKFSTEEPLICPDRVTFPCPMGLKWDNGSMFRCPMGFKRDNYVLGVKVPNVLLNRGGGMPMKWNSPS